MLEDNARPCLAFALFPRGFDHSGLIASIRPGLLPRFYSLYIVASVVLLFLLLTLPTALGWLSGATMKGGSMDVLNICCRYHHSGGPRTQPCGGDQYAGYREPDSDSAEKRLERARELLATAVLALDVANIDHARGLIKRVRMLLP